MAILVGRSTTSSIHRYIFNKINTLRELTGYSDAEPISRAHLPRLLNRLDWVILNDLIEQHFGIKLKRNENEEWVAIDGKVLRGTIKGGDKQTIILAVTHDSREVIAQARQEGKKSSEIPVVRKLIKNTELEKQKITLDAHHCNPQTTAQINQAGGSYVIQVKGNQPILLEQCRTLGTSEKLNFVDVEKAHGRLTTRQVDVFSMDSLNLDQRWENSGLKTLAVVKRETTTTSTNITSLETSWYISNCPIDLKNESQTATEMAQVIRNHWGVESDNYIRDKTFKEDDVKTKNGNQGQIMGRLRGLGMWLIRKTKTNNFQAKMEEFTDCPNTLVSMLKSQNFL